jgi:hypothetical protein
MGLLYGRRALNGRKRRVSRAGRSDEEPSADVPDCTEDHGKDGGAGHGPGHGPKKAAAGPVVSSETVSWTSCGQL